MKAFFIYFPPLPSLPCLQLIRASRRGISTALFRTLIHSEHLTHYSLSHLSDPLPIVWSCVFLQLHSSMTISSDSLLTPVKATAPNMEGENYNTERDHLSAGWARAKSPFRLWDLFLVIFSGCDLDKATKFIHSKNLWGLQIRPHGWRASHLLEMRQYFHQFNRNLN